MTDEIRDGIDYMLDERHRRQERGDLDVLTDEQIAQAMCTTVAEVRKRIPVARANFAWRFGN